MTETLYPFEDLRRAHRKGIEETMRDLKVSGKSYQQYRDHGFRREVAERMALKLGWHPYEVWPEMVEDDLVATALLGQECAAWDCTERFIPSRRGGNRRWPQRFCSSGCRGRDKWRRQIGWTPPTLKVCAEPGCNAEFVPVVKRPAQRFCSRTCRDREKARRYRTIPAVVARRRELQRRYYREDQELKARRAARRQAAA